MKKQIVVIGAGYGGLLATKRLAKKLKHEDVEITIIDRNPFSTMLTELHEVAAGRVHESAIRMDLQKIFAGRKVNVVLDSVTDVDYTAKEIHGTTASYPYDVMVMAAGSKPMFFGIPGAQEHSFTLWSYDDAIVLRDHIESMFMQASKELDEKRKNDLLTFYVVGAGLTGVEMMGELAEYVPILCRTHAIDPKEVTLVQVDALSRSVTMLPDKLANKVQRRLEKMGVQLKFETRVLELNEGTITYEYNGDHYTTDTQTVIWTAGIEAQDITRSSSEALDARQRGGRIQVDPYLRAQGHDDVFVVGDNLFYVLEGQDQPVPQMVENAEHSAKCAADNIVTTLLEKGTMKAYEPKFHGTMVCVGGKYGVARVGFPNFMFNLPSFLAMLSKHFINCVYFVQVMGFYKVFSYLKAEFFTIRHKRSFVGGHLSNRTPSFLLVFVRVWLGLVWLYNGLVKVGEGWLAGTNMLPQFMEYGKIFETIINGAQSKASDLARAAADVASTATSGATGSAEVGEALLNLRFFDVFHLFIISETAIKGNIANTSLSTLAVKLNIPVMNWVMEHWILPNNGLSLFFQYSIVIAQILVGLALIAGLFTTLAAFGSLVMQLMFLTTTGWYFDTIWMFAAGIAVMFSGTTMALDYWVMPKLGAWWRNIPFVRKWYLYQDE